ncbi:unnamed protein product [Withania somnifera]
MKRRLAASISALMAGYKVEKNALDGRRCFLIDYCYSYTLNLTSFQLQRFKSSKRLLFKVHDDDNDFSDLGPPVERAFRQLKLVTEKPDLFLKLDNGRKVSSRKCRSESEQHIKDIILTLDKPCQSELDNGDDASGLTCTTSDAASMNGRRSISVGNVPSTISLSQLVKAVSVFGKVCIQFEDSIVVTIRIEKISKDATFSEIHSVCKSVGMTEALAWVRKDAIDALFTVENDTESESILKKLNRTIVGGDCLSASLLHSKSSSALMSENEDARCKMALQISNYLRELKGQLMEKEEELANFRVLKLHMEDLQMLHEGIMHLEDLPSIIYTSDN